MKRVYRPSQLWSVILAAGGGARMQPMIQRWLGKPLPKQYCTFVGTRSIQRLNKEPAFSSDALAAV